MVTEQTAEERLKAGGLRVTHARVTLLHLLLDAALEKPRQHLTVEQIYSQLQQRGEHQIPLNTVYRVMTQFEQSGMVCRHFFESGHAYYELEPEEHHDHMVCNQCGDVIEFVDDDIERLQELVAQKYGFRIQSHALHLFGTCKRCTQEA